MNTKGKVSPATKANAKKVKELLSKKKNWTRGAYAIDKIGNPVGAKDEAAISWCLLGACGKVTRTSEQYWRLRNYLEELREKYRFKSYGLASLNDGRDGYRRVMKLLEKA